MSDVTVSDHFCGAGGSTEGAEQVPGVRVRVAINHWDLAIETHNTNYPHVDHDITDLAVADPRRYPYTDILWASPECTYWSQGRGEKQDFAVDAAPNLFDEDDRPLPSEAAMRSRALMEDVPRFADHHRYKAIIVENVPDILKWTGMEVWLARMRRLGYRHRIMTLNSAFAHQLGAPAPQLRDRVYIVFWLERYPEPDLDRWTRPLAWCPGCEAVVTAMYAPKDPGKQFGRYGSQYVYRCPSTSCRNAVVHPYVLPAAAAIDWDTPGERIGDRTRPLADKTIARIEAGLRRYARPIALEAAGNTFERRPGVRAWPVDEPLRTLHTTASKALAYPPFLTIHRGGPGDIRTRSIGDPMSTFTASGNHHGLLVPVEGRDGKHAQPTTGPARTQTARNETGLLVPAGGTWNEEARTVGEPMRTRTTRETEAFVVVPLRGWNRPKLVDEPLDTIMASGNHHGLVSIADHQGLVWSPNVLYAYDSGAFRSTGQPLPTQTTVEGDALLESDVSVEDCRFRMLMPEEIKLGMAFQRRFRLLGTKREQVRMCGNAVTPPVARDLIAAVVEAITGEAIAA